LRGTRAYDTHIREGALAGRNAGEIYEEIATSDVRDACDVLRPVFDRSKGRDGFVSLEVSPHLARDPERSVFEARRLARAVDRPNLMVKIPGTREGIGAIETLLEEGINVNVTLLFSVGRYEQVAEAYLRALERRLEARRRLDAVASVASFFLSRIDVMVDAWLAQYPGGESAYPGRPDAHALAGRAAVANAKLAYRLLQRILRGKRWKALEAKGARPQRLLWASTGTKNPAYSDVMYVEPLIGPFTVSTMPVATLEAFADHGEARATAQQDTQGSLQLVRELRRLGIDLKHATDQLEIEGIDKFIKPFDSLLAALEAKRARYANAGDVASLEMARHD